MVRPFPHRNHARALIAALALFVVSLSSSISRADETSAQPIKVAVAGSEPFVTSDSGALEGLSVDVFRAIATRANVPFVLVPATSVPDALRKVEAHEVDAAVGPISITAERAEHVRFTQPYFHASLSILARTGDRSAWSRIAPFFSKPFFYALSGLLLVLSIVGVLLWLAERRSNPEQFPREPARGIGNGLWLALVTMTTVGYGDRAPTTLAGRIVAGAWMVLSLIVASSLTAGIATTLTLASLDRGTIETADQLRGRRVAVVRGTPTAAFVLRYGARVVEVPDVDAAIARLTHGDVDAVVHDRPILQHLITTENVEGVQLGDARYAPQGYGFALPLDTSLQHRLNVALLQAVESDQIARIEHAWVGSPPR